jgi:hypothetical protein
VLARLFGPRPIVSHQLGLGLIKKSASNSSGSEQKNMNVSDEAAFTLHLNTSDLWPWESRVRAEAFTAVHSSFSSSMQGT